jgi:hypothetical protein
MAGYKAFQSRFMKGDLLEQQNFTDWEGRKLRYSIMWAMYGNTAYQRVNTWAQAYKSEYGLYRHTRGIYNPSYRLGEFWKVHLLGGKLDPEAGDGAKIPSALPIVTKNEKLRIPIAQVWDWSNWQMQKDILGLWTPIMGDGVIKVVDDPAKERVYMSPINPGILKDIDLDEFGNVKGYVIEEQRLDPRNKNKTTMVTYREVAFRDGENVVYQTYLNDKLYSWDGTTPEWSEDYGFIPLVIFPHNNVGMGFGWSELYPGLVKFREVDDLASKLSDQIRKMVDAPWLFVNVQDPNKVNQSTPKTSGTTPNTNNPQPGREEMKVLYGTTGADAKPLVADLNIADSSAYIQEILSSIEEDYPELNADIHNVEGEISGRALRINRAPAENKVLQRRPNYDDAIRRAQMMAVSIGGMRGYEGFDGFNKDSYENGDLEHTIGERPVFNKDPFDDLEYDKEFWDVATQAKAFGIPPLLFLKQKGWTDEQINEIKNSDEYKAHLATLKAATEAANNPPTPTTNRFGRGTNE